MMQQHCLSHIVASVIRHRARLGAIAVILTCGAACRDEAPPERFNRNLGTAERPLLPTAKLAFDESLYKDRADGIEPLAEMEDPAAHDEHDGGHDDADDDEHEADREMIAELIETVREAMLEKDFERVSERLVERQRDVMKGAAPAMKDVAIAMEAFVAAVEPIDPQPAFAAMMIPMFRAELEFPVQVDDVTFDSDTAAFAPIHSGTLGFEKVDDAWFVATDELAETAEEQNRRATLIKKTLDDATRILGDSALAAAERDMQVVMLFQKMTVDIASPPG